MSQLVELYEFEKVDAIKPNAMFHQFLAKSMNVRVIFVQSIFKWQ